MHRTSRFLAVLLTAWLSTAAHAQAAPQLLFQTGFEGDTRVLPPDMNGDRKPGFEFEHLAGRDPSRPRSDFARDLPNGGRFFAEYTGGTPEQRFARVIDDPTKPGNRVLQFWLGDAYEASENQRKARVQTSLYDMKPGLKEFFHSVRVYLHPDFKVLEDYPQRITWLTLAEYWNNEWWVPGEKYGFRITVGMGKPGAGAEPLSFIVHAERAGQHELWEGHNRALKLPIGQWFTLETYFREGDAANGRFYLALVPDGGQRQVVADIRNITHNPSDPAPDGMTGFNPMKLYTSKEVVGWAKARGKALQVYWDDFELWANRRPAE